MRVGKGSPGTRGGFSRQNAHAHSGSVCAGGENSTRALDRRGFCRPWYRNTRGREWRRCRSLGSGGDLRCVGVSAGRYDAPMLGFPRGGPPNAPVSLGVPRSTARGPSGQPAWGYVRGAARAYGRQSYKFMMRRAPSTASPHELAGRGRAPLDGCATAAGGDPSGHESARCGVSR